MKKQSKKNTNLGTENVKEDLTAYKLTKQTDVDTIKDPHFNPKANKSRIEKKFLKPLKILDLPGNLIQLMEPMH